MQTITELSFIEKFREEITKKSDILHNGELRIKNELEEILNDLFERYVYEDIMGKKIKDNIENLTKDLDIKLALWYKNFIDPGIKYKFDDIGQPKYTKEIWNRTVSVLKNVLSSLWNNQIYLIKEEKKYIPIPSVFPYIVDSSFDIYWNTDKFKLLINIPSNSEDRIVIYGFSKGHKKIIDNDIDYDLVNSLIFNWIKKVLDY